MYIKTQVDGSDSANDYTPSTREWAVFKAHPRIWSQAISSQDLHVPNSRCWHGPTDP